MALFEILMEWDSVLVHHNNLCWSLSLRTTHSSPILQIGLDAHVESLHRLSFHDLLQNRTFIIMTIIMAVKSRPLLWSMTPVLSKQANWRRVPLSHKIIPDWSSASTLLQLQCLARTKVLHAPFYKNNIVILFHVFLSAVHIFSVIIIKMLHRQALLLDKWSPTTE